MNAQLIAAERTNWLSGSNRGHKFFEYSNHLGNVLTVTSDKKLYDPASQSYSAQVVSVSDYYPFGWAMPQRTYSPSNYRFGYQGSEKNKEINSGSYTTEFRQLDTRVGRWSSVDPAAHLYYSWSPYGSQLNSPLSCNDPTGATVTPGSEKRVDNMVSETETKITEWEGKRDNAKVTLDALLKEKRSDPDFDKAKDLREAQVEYGKANYVLGKLNKHLKYLNYFITSDKDHLSIQNSLVSLDGGTPTGGVTHSSDGTFTIWNGGYPELDHHEFTHVIQDLVGEGVMYVEGAAYGGTYDVYDEVDAYQVQYIFGGVPNKEDGTSIESITEITVGYVQMIKVGSYQPYINLPSQRIGVNTTLRTAVRAHGNNSKRLGISPKVYNEELYGGFTIGQFLRSQNDKKIKKKESPVFLLY